MKVFLLLTMSMSISLFAATELKEGTSFAGYTAEEPELIQITLQKGSAELIYKKLKVVEDLVTDFNGFKVFEKRYDTIKCTKVSLEEVESGFDCKINFTSSGIINNIF